MTETRVINKRSGEPYDVYIGRGSRWGNPYKIGRDGSREEVIAKYERYLLSSPNLLGALPTLKGKTLACWCKPDEGFSGRILCHGQILAGLADDVPPEHIE